MKRPAPGTVRYVLALLALLFAASACFWPGPWRRGDRGYDGRRDFHEDRGWDRR